MRPDPQITDLQSKVEMLQERARRAVATPSLSLRQLQAASCSMDDATKVPVDYRLRKELRDATVTLSVRMERRCVLMRPTDLAVFATGGDGFGAWARARGLMYTMV
jgi:hypothetical protein